MSNDNIRYRSGSISMFIDKNKQHKKWLDDELVLKCNTCNLDFNFINRKHHCRYCGKIFCYNCSNYWIKISNNQLISNIQNNYKSDEQKRVCQYCFIELSGYNKQVILNNFFNLLDLNLDDYKNILFVCKSWNKIANHYIDTFRELQYVLPNHDYNKTEINILKNNIDFFAGHSRWILQIILNRQIFNTNKIKYILKKKKNIKCKRLNCNNDCSDYLLPSNIILCLNKGIYNIDIIKYLVKYLKDIKKNEILYYLTIITFSLRYYIHHNDCLETILEFLFKLSIHSIEFSNLFFWDLTHYIDDEEYKQFYINIREQLIKNLEKKNYELFKNIYEITNIIVDIPNIKQNDFKKYLSIINNKNFKLPINIHEEYSYICLDKIKIINSKTKPVIIPCIISNSIKIREYMIKNEDIRKEYIIMNIIKLMDLYLKQVGLDLNIVTYNILPISSKRGFIEFVENSHTLYDIREEHLFSIQNFIMEKNPNITAKELRDNFTKSCAAYCIITYLLGIGDRHLENIMITNKGYIFNVDFGYVLGKDPKFISPEFRITSEMIDAMGGYQSRYYKQFQYYCKTAFNTLRIHTPIFYSYLSLLYKIKPAIQHPLYTKQDINKHIMEKFYPFKPYEHIDFQYKILANSNTYSGNMIDFLHKKSKNSSSSSFTSPTCNEAEFNNENDTLYTSTINILENTKDLGYSLGNGIKSMIWKT